jgi:hypothetical protein
MSVDALISDSDLARLAVGLVIDLTAMASILILVYRRPRSARDIMFMLTTINVVVFGITYAMLHVTLGVGAAFGLFALFGIMRFRTKTLAVTEMSFLFASLALAVLNASGLQGMSYQELLVINAITIGSLIAGSRLFIEDDVRQPETAMVTYDRADLLSGGSSDPVVSDLRARTGLNVESVSVKSLDLTANIAVLQVRHRTTETPLVGSGGGNGQAGGAPMSIVLDPTSVLQPVQIATNGSGKKSAGNPDESLNA